MFWFWFYVVIIPLMIVLDAVWWVAAMRLTKGSRWRILVSIFMAAQTAALVLIIVGSWRHVDLLGQAPKAVLVSAIIWHFFGVGVLLPVGIVCVCAGVVRGMARLAGVRRDRPVAGSRQREFADAP